MTALDAGAERTELICGPHHPFKRGHHRRAVPPAAPVLADRDALNVTGTQRPARMQQAPLNHTAMTDQLALLHHQRMHAAEHVLEGVIGDAVKGSIQQAADSRPSAGIKVRSVGGSQLDHVRPILAGASVPIRLFPPSTLPQAGPVNAGWPGPGPEAARTTVLTPPGLALR